MVWDDFLEIYQLLDRPLYYFIAVPVPINTRVPFYRNSSIPVNLFDSSKNAPTLANFLLIFHFRDAFDRGIFSVASLDATTFRHKNAAFKCHGEEDEIGQCRPYIYNFINLSSIFTERANQ